MKRSEANQKYKWDFTHLYKDVDAWKADLNQVAKLGDEIASLKGQLNIQLQFYRYLDLERKLGEIATKLSIYTHLSDVDQTVTLYQELEGLMMNVSQKLGIQLAWVEPELKTVGKTKILDFLMAKPEYQAYVLDYELFFEEATHILSEHDEELLSKVALSRGAIDGMYDPLAYADNQETFIEWKGQKVSLTGSVLMEIMEDSDPVKDQKLRQEAAQNYSANFINHKHSFAKIYEGILQGETESIRLRDYPSVLEAALSGDSVPASVYQKLLGVGKQHIDVFVRYNEILKKGLGLEKFYATDRQLKLRHVEGQTFTVEEGQKVIKEALGVLGDEYLKNLELAWADNRIDYYEDTNKRSGAYSTGGDGVEPIILMNWDDKLNSVNTLAHESGHSVHTLFADQNQPHPLNNYPIILAEVASTINEHLLFDYMYAHAKSDDEKIYLLQQRVFDLVSTFYRQIQFADFEMRAHDLVADGVPQTAESLAQLFNETQNDYGYGVFDKVNEDGLPYGWPRVSHFFHSPYYVYKYAIDVTASFKLYSDIKAGNIETTLNFLKAGGSARPLEVLKQSGVDFEDEATYQPLIAGMKSYLDDLETLLNKKN